MTASKRLDYFLQPGALSEETRGVLVEVDASTVYTAIEAIVGTTGRSFWADRPSYLDGYSRMTQLAGSLLMDAADRIIRALWEVRGVSDATLQPTELGLYPGPIEENEIRSLWLSSENHRNLYDSRSNDTLLLLDQIRELLEQIRDTEGGFTAEEKLQLFQNLAAIIAAL